jgi:hypothetical protein
MVIGCSLSSSAFLLEERAVSNLLLHKEREGEGREQQKMLYFSFYFYLNMIILAGSKNGS